MLLDFTKKQFSGTAAGLYTSSREKRDALREAILVREEHLTLERYKIHSHTRYYKLLGIFPCNYMIFTSLMTCCPCPKLHRQFTGIRTNGSRMKVVEVSTLGRGAMTLRSSQLISC